ncbi:DNA polymerase V [Pantoea stewartii]|uniref:DNA polymerase V n=1 Tax=Pantoea stewartii TaxID=66269 RepID=UPI001EF02A9A|nr:DNA polymerase V [Pantoea stewartii]
MAISGYLFFEVMKRSTKYGFTIPTFGFVAELAERNWGFSHKQANEWIAQNMMTFRDQLPDEGENRLWQRFCHYGNY